MDDIGFQCDLSDFEMLDDASEEAFCSSLAEPLPVALVVDEDISSEQTSCTEHAAFVVNLEEDSRSIGPTRLFSDDDRPGSPHVNSPAHLDRACQQAVPKGEKDIRSNVLAKIEGIFEAMVDVLLNERGQLSIQIKTRSRSRNQQHNQPGAARSHTETVQHLCFPGKTGMEAWRFGMSSMQTSIRPHGTNTAQLS
jgi:hypothetical protein